MKPAPPLLAALALAAPAAAQLDHVVRMDLEEKVWDVECRLPNPGGEAFAFWFARWTPGAYHLADYGRFVVGLEARAADGRELGVERVDDSHFRIAAAGAEEVLITYRAESSSTLQFSNGVLDVEANRIARDYAFLNSVSLFGFVPGRLDEPYAVRFELPEGWRTGTVLEADGEGAYHAPSYYRMEDSPFLFSPELVTRELEVAGKPLSISVIGKREGQLEKLIDGCVAIVKASAELLGGLPYERYEFLFGFVPGSGGSGLEHTESTLILMPHRVPVEQAWGIIAHEFFHLWCAERIHVEGIRDPDFTQPFQTSTIWVNESVTEYFSHRILVQAGLTSEEEFLARFAAPSGQLEQFKESGMLLPGTETSRRARQWDGIEDLMPFVLSMYMHGPRTIFGLDMEMRAASGGRTGVVDLVRYLMDEYASKGRGFPEDGVPAIINRVAGADLTGYYEAHIDGLEPLDTERHLAVIGYRLDGDDVVPVDDPSEEQLAARADFFSVDG